ncbi:hypothetical protein L195_g047884, partial [Trifolium pratense]
RAACSAAWPRAAQFIVHFESDTHVQCRGTCVQRSLAACSARRPACSAGFCPPAACSAG